MVVVASKHAFRHGYKLGFRLVKKNASIGFLMAWPPVPGAVSSYRLPYLKLK
jgi:hypothetical protein